MQSTVEDQIHQEEKETEDKDSHDHDCRGGLYFAARRRNNLPHLRAYVAQKTRRIRPEAHCPSRHIRQGARLLTLFNRCFARHTSNPSEQFPVRKFWFSARAPRSS